MSNLTLISLVSLIGWLVLMLFAFRRQTVPPGRALTLALVWIGIFVALTLIISFFA